MAFDLPTALARFLQIYKLDREAVDRFLFEENDEFEKRDPGASAWDERAATEVSSRTLLENTDLKKRAKDWLAMFPDVPEREPPSDEFYRLVFGDKLAGLAEGSELKGEEFEKWFFQELRKKDLEDREHKLQELRPPDFGTYFAWDFLFRVKTLVSRVQDLDSLEYRDIVQGSLRDLFQEAHRCYLYGLDVSVAVMCGAILEQALKEKTGKDWKLGPLLEEAKSCGLLTDEEWGAGDDVRELRNKAAHNPSAFLHRPEIERASLLSNTRRVVKALF